MKIHLATVVVAALLSVSALAEIDEAQLADFELTCHKYAQEDGIAQEEMETYLSQCVQDLVASEPSAAGESVEGDPKE